MWVKEKANVKSSCRLLILDPPSCWLSFQEYRKPLRIVLPWSPDLDAALWYQVPRYSFARCSPIITLVKYSCQQGRTTQSNSTVVSYLRQPVRFLRDSNTGRLLVTVTCSHPSLQTNVGVASAPQSFAKADQGLDDSDSCPQSEKLGTNYTYNQIDVCSSSLPNKVQQNMIISMVDYIVKVKLKAKHAQVVMEYLMDMLKTGYFAVSAILKDASYQNVENVHTGMSLIGMLDGIFKINLQRYSRAPEFMDAITRRLFNLRTFKIHWQLSWRNRWIAP